MLKSAFSASPELGALSRLIRIGSHVPSLPGYREASHEREQRFHANNRTRRRFLPNLHEQRFWVDSEKRFVRLRVSTNGIRTIDKLGIDAVLADMRKRGEKV